MQTGRVGRMSFMASAMTLGVACAAGWIGSAAISSSAASSDVPNVRATHDLPNHYHLGTMYPAGRVASCSDGGETYNDTYDSFCKTDNAYVTSWIDRSNRDCPEDDGVGLSSEAEANITYTLEGRVAPTVLENHPVSSSLCPGDPGGPELHGDSETDIIYKRTGDVTGNTNGWTYCNDAANSLECDQAYIDVNTGSGWATKSVYCHETGHAVGIMHNDESTELEDPTANDPRAHCMISPNGHLSAIEDWGPYNRYAVDHGY